MRITEVPMKCSLCGHQCAFGDCNLDDPIGDGIPACPIADCGGEMKIMLDNGIKQR